MRSFERLNDRSGARRPSDSVQAKALAANVPEFFAVPQPSAGEVPTSHVILSSTVDLYVAYFDGLEAANIVQNGGFATDTLFTKGTGVTIAAGVASWDGTQTADSDLTQVEDDLLTPVIEGQAYLATFTVSGYSAGNVTPVVGDTEGTDRAANGTFSEVIIAGSGADIGVRGDADFIGSIDNLSIQPCAKVPVDDTTGLASELIPAGVGEQDRTRLITGIDTISVVAAATAIVTASFFTS